VRKDTIGQVVSRGFALDVHGAIGAPKESYVRIRRAEPGGEDGKGLWTPAAVGFRPGFESAALRRYLSGQFITLKRR
jgi:nitrate reductase alpha subunit